MSDRVKPAQPRRAPFDSQFAKEESHVRSRGKRDEQRDTPSARDDDEVTSVDARRAPAVPRHEAEAVPAERETVAERTTRIDQKLTRAGMVLERLAPMDSRARLLGSAMLRRDEVLLDAVLAQMTDELLSATSSRRPPRR